MSFKKLVEVLKAQSKAPLAKSVPAAYPLSTQSLDTALKSCAAMGINAKTQTMLKDLHAAGCAAGVSDLALEDRIATIMRGIATKKPMTKSAEAMDALNDQLASATPAAFAPSAGIAVDHSTEALHRARQQEISDGRFIDEVIAKGIPAAEVVQLESVLAASRGLPDEVRQQGIQAVRQQVESVAHLSPAARGINWD